MSTDRPGMKLLCALVVLLGTSAAPAAAYASDTDSYCYIPPQTVTVDGHTVSTPTVRVPCPESS